MNQLNDDNARQQPTALGRRELMKLGAGAVVTALSAPKVAAQGRGGAAQGAAPAMPASNTAGYKNPAKRPFGQGPMDETTTKVVKYVTEFSQARLTPAVIEALNNIMVDSMAALITGLDSPPSRISARLARTMPAGDMKSTILGYGVTATPELAAFANGVTMRHTDFNDLGRGHPSEMIPGILAIAEAMHSSGSEVLAAITMGYEIAGVNVGGMGAATAMAAGKLMKLNEDQLANALSFAATRSGPSRGNGILNMWKSCRSAEDTKTAIWGALLAREGFTTNAEPYEGRGGIGHREFQLPEPRDIRWRSQDRQYTVAPPPGFKDSPDAGVPVVWTGFKKYPAEGSTQATLDMMPEIRAWVKVDEIEWIHHQLPRGNFLEIADAPKWDPTNRETADHSLPYLMARALIDGEIYIDSFTDAKIMDPAVRALMAKITVFPMDGWSGNAPAHITIRKKTGEEKSWDTQDGRRISAPGEHLKQIGYRLSPEEIVQKFNRACTYSKMETSQRGQALAAWSNLSAVKDIGDAMHTLAKFGNPKPL